MSEVSVSSNEVKWASISSNEQNDSYFFIIQKNMIYFTDIYGLYSPMVVILFECELRLVQFGDFQ